MRVQRYRILDKKQKQLVNIYSYTVTIKPGTPHNDSKNLNVLVPSGPV